MSFVLGTAGHVDHGKSVLVQALTGIDPDRLREEKERGMTIDLGFAWLKLPSGRAVGIVDVPGHEHFIKNMLAGVGGIDVALLVVAADEGVMPQTREHLAILDLLQVDRGIAIIAKKDLVDEEWLELVTLEVGDVLAGTTLAQAPIIAVSALTGEGLPELVSTIDRVLDSATPKKDIGRPRLPVDRVFTMAGFGTVVTGTLVDGSLSQGQEVEILPSALAARIRGLQSHKQKIDIASPGNRVAANLSGVATGELTRGDVVTTPGWLTPTRAFDVKLRLLPSAPRPLPHNATVTFHHGAAEVLGKVRLLERDKIEPGETAWAQFMLTQPIAAVKDDRFIIRSPQQTLGGGQIVGIRAKRHRRFRPDVIEGLATREAGTTEQIILAIVQEEEPLELERLLPLCNLSRGEAEEAIRSLAAQKKVIVLGDMMLLFSAQGWEKLAKQAKLAVQRYHQRFPLRHGPPKEELRGKLKTPTKFFARALEQLIQEGTLIEAGTTVRLPDHKPQPTPEQQAEVDAFLDRLARNPYLPTLDPLPEPDLLNLLIEQRQVVKASDDVIFLASAYDKMVDGIVAQIKSQGKVTVAEVRDLFHTSRKYALALMEYLDAQKLTRRIGDERVLR
ncbi:MAG: selenocysteine-specific translation elongation factor [Dehalococcoidia bacterium]|nr:MAG: selenocysteine-specific translation elongation factor [Dehalococcoidia bacterium]